LLIRRYLSLVFRFLYDEIALCCIHTLTSSGDMVIGNLGELNYHLLLKTVFKNCADFGLGNFALGLGNQVLF
jgi:hypothetical protein